MSTYSKVTRHPQTGAYEEATWIDDYFGHHIYGVMFKSDDKVYPTEIVKAHEIDHFWAEDIKNAIRTFTDGTNETLIAFLEVLDVEYKKRWEDDPLYGGGAYLPEDGEE